LKAENKLVDFGIKTVGADVTKVITLMNNSKREITISFDLDVSLGIKQKEQFEKYFVTYIPEEKLTIHPRERK
jgi:hypothetical protein